jgi:hypothetical protein
MFIDFAYAYLATELGLDVAKRVFGNPTCSGDYELWFFGCTWDRPHGDSFQGFYL